MAIWLGQHRDETVKVLLDMWHARASRSVLGCAGSGEGGCGGVSERAIARGQLEKLTVRGRKERERERERERVVFVLCCCAAAVVVVVADKMLATVRRRWVEHVAISSGHGQHHHHHHHEHDGSRTHCSTIRRFNCYVALFQCSLSVLVLQHNASASTI